MLRVALTGGIATGKSYVAQRFRQGGIPVVDADVLARQVVEPGSPGLRAIVDRFGPDVVDRNGALNRPRLASIVFSDSVARRDLEAIVHPAVRAGIDRFLADVPPATPFAVADIPLLFETGRAGEFDVVVVAACPPAMQIERVMARDRSSRAEAEQRLAAQWPIDDKVERADYVIDTGVSFDATDAAVDGVIAALRSRAAEPA